MTNTVGITDVIKSLSVLQTRCNLHQAIDEQFFREWMENLPELNQQEQAGINLIKQRYDYHRVDGPLLEGTINLIVVSPLLELAGFLDPPFRIRSPYGVALKIDDPDEIIRGFIWQLITHKRLNFFCLQKRKSGWQKLLVEKKVKFACVLPPTDN